MLKDSLLKEIEETRFLFFRILETIPESDYSFPTDNPAWTIGDVLYHITLGPYALAFEIWMIVHVRGLFQFGMRALPSKLFNRINALFARRGSRIRREMLIRAYENGHTTIRSSLKRMKDGDFQKSVIYPVDFVFELAGEATAERLFHYVKEHYDIHIKQIQYTPPAHSQEGS